MNRADLVACPECDALHRKPPLAPHSTARCTRCRAVLYRRASGSVERALALNLAGLVTLLIANAFPIVALESNGIETRATLAGAIAILWTQNMQAVAVLVAASTFVFPLLELTAMTYLLALLWAGRRPRGLNLLLRCVQAARPWQMIEVFVLGALVALVKLSSFARVLPEQALYAFGGLTVLLAVVISRYDPRNLWDVADALPSGGRRR